MFVRDYWNMFIAFENKFILKCGMNNRNRNAVCLLHKKRKILPVHCTFLHENLSKKYFANKKTSGHCTQT